MAEGYDQSTLSAVVIYTKPDGKYIALWTLLKKSLVDSHIST